MSPKVYIIIRTHNRPQEFYNCIQSIYKQSIKPEIIIISDDKNDNYINNISLSYKIFYVKYIKPKWWIRHHNPFNDYFNQVLSLIPNGNFIYYLDDDDELVDTNWIKTILDINTNVLIARFQLGKSHNNLLIGNKIVRGNIGTSCFAIKSEIAKEFKWPSKGAGDYFFIKEVVKKYKPVFIPLIAGKVQIDLQHSWGVRKSY